MLSSIQDVSYDVESLYTKIFIEETVNYIIEQIYIHKKLIIYSKLILRRLLIKLATYCTFKFDSRFFKQVDGCTMWGPQSIVFRDIYIVKIENGLVILSKSLTEDLYMTFIADRN